MYREKIRVTTVLVACDAERGDIELKSVNVWRQVGLNVKIVTTVLLMSGGLGPIKRTMARDSCIGFCLF